MATWNLKDLLYDLHDDIQDRLARSRKLMGHSTAKGDASEDVWLELFQKYLPKRYQVEKAYVVDSNGEFSDQMDIVIFDRQYTPFIFLFEGSMIIPAESVYAVFECKQDFTKEHIEYARKKISSVRRLKRTSLPIPYAGGEYPAKELMPILGGILTFETKWADVFGDPFQKAASGLGQDQLDCGCIASHGFFYRLSSEEDFQHDTDRKPATGFLFKLISELQKLGTVPMIDIDSYAKWLTK